MSLGLDVGTSFLVTTRESDKGKMKYKEFRDAFFRIKPASPIADKMIEKGLKGSKFFKDSDGSYIIIGQEAIEKAVERHSSANRPLYRGVLSPREPQARRVLKFILSELLGKPEEENEKLIYTIPAFPINQTEETFDISFHCDAIARDLKELGYSPIPIFEAEALCYSELANDDYTGVAVSCGAGMTNFCIMSSGEPVSSFSITTGGDWIDRMASIAVNEPDSVVQVEKEQGIWRIGEHNSNRILEAVSIAYGRLIKFIIEQFTEEINRSSKLPKFSQSLPMIISGGTSKAEGFIDNINEQLINVELPFKISKVYKAADPLRTVARGCCIAAAI